MSKQLKKVILALFVVGFVGIFSLSANAAGPRDGEIIDGSLLTSEGSSEVRKDNLRRSGLISYSITTITNRYNNGAIYLYGFNNTGSEVERLRVYLDLEKLVGNEWVPVFSEYGTKYDSNFFNYGLYVTISPGHYYRLSTLTTAKQEAYTDAMEVSTDGIFIG